ncbi:CLUMA_CG004528, isoform A [Clunio marinus]|uniref:CLUMA_CG004528, isoform A n=1 Tax=Clunio marinus TaxID=568069 RepID=A0A1J1HWE3_9DIPT|nr:CLUMA_CG004528, isoform A [Clunio marinus]
MRSFIELVLYLIFVMFLYKNRSYIGYHLKFYFYYTWVITLSALLLPIFALRPRKENLEKDKSFVIVANHQSSLDIIGDIMDELGLQACLVSFIIINIGNDTVCIITQPTDSLIKSNQSAEIIDKESKTFKVHKENYFR